MEQVHLSLVDRTPTLAVVAMRAGSDKVGPDVLTTQVAWDDMVDG